jgi:hypothetical protein
VAQLWRPLAWPALAGVALAALWHAAIRRSSASAASRQAAAILKYRQHRNRNGENISHLAMAKMWRLAKWPVSAIGNGGINTGALK